MARNAGQQLDALIDEVDRRARLLELPVFVALSADDTEIDASAAQRWFCRQLIGPRELVWYAPGAEPPADCRFIVCARERSLAGHSGSRAPGPADRAG